MRLVGAPRTDIIQPVLRVRIVGAQRVNLPPEGLVRRPEYRHTTAVRDSFWLLGDVDLLFQRFDARLACLTPRAEGAFVQLFPRGAECFVTTLLRAVDALGAEPEPAPAAEADSQVRSLAARLLSVGMQRPDFVHVGSSLYRAARESYTGEWTAELDQAWSQVCDWLVASLQAADVAQSPAITWATQRSVADVELSAQLDRLATRAG